MAEGHVSAFYRCDMGDTLTVYRNPGDETYVNLRWHGKVRRMEREITTTGAGRYENKKEGLLLISIPSKSMLFDSRKGRQLANECRTTEQLADNTARTETQAEAKPKSRAKRRRRR
jgi:hypothetical protein